MKLLPDRLADKPHYVFHPVRLARRAVGPSRARTSSAGAVAVARLPWGLELNVEGSEAIGYSILTGGVFDPAVTETVHRLIDPGDLVVDVGANVGYLTSLAAARSGATGRVVAFEPHPRVFELLSLNASAWGARPGLATVELYRAAVSDHSGVGQLASGPAFEENMGLASLANGARAAGSSEGIGEVLDVSVIRLDGALGGSAVGLLKIDVEGHEPGVLRGAEGLLRAGLVRDIVFEDHDPYPDASTELLERFGYTLFALSNDLFGLRLCEPARRGPVRGWPGPSYLATRDPARALARLGERGWQVCGIGLGRRGRRRAGAAGGSASPADPAA